MDKAKGEKTKNHNKKYTWESGSEKGCYGKEMERKCGVMHVGKNLASVLYE